MIVGQELLELLWTEEKLQSRLKLTKFQNPFNMEKSVGLSEIPCTKKLLSIEAKIYSHHSSKIAKAGPGYNVWP